MGSVFGNLTKDSVSSGGKTQFYDSPGAAAISAAQQTRVPTTITDANGTVSSSGGNTPVMAKPTFNEANSDGFLSKGLTTKGKILGALLAAGQGAALGAGQPTFGAGFERASIFPIQQRRLNLANQQEEQEAQIRQQNIEAAPEERRQRGLLVNSQINANNARGEYNRDRMDANDTKYVPGVGLFRTPSKDNTGGVVPGSEPKEKAPPPEKLPNTEAALRVAAQRGVPGAKEALDGMIRDRKAVKATKPPSAPREMETQVHNGVTYQRTKGSNAPWKRTGN